MKQFFLWMTLSVVMFFVSCQSEPVKISIVATSDLETSLLAYDYKYSVDSKGGAAILATYLKDLKNEQGAQNVIYVDNGDLLYGWPLNYYMSRLDNYSSPIASEVMNLLGCEVYGIGEGDLSQGSDLLQRHIKATKGMVVCANLLDSKSNEPLYKPYTVIVRNGIKIAFLGLITEDAAKYMNGKALDGIKIGNAEECAKRWIAEMRKSENPDVVIGLFHMGASSVSKRNNVREDIGLTVARNVAGFDAVICGHDGFRRSRTITNIEGKEIVVASPGRRGMYAVNVTVTGKRSDKGLNDKHIDVSIKSLLAMNADKEFVASFKERTKALRTAFNTPIGSVSGDANAMDALFGSSAYVDFIHKIQLKYSGADLSLAHPYDIYEILPSGNVSVSDIRCFYPGRGKLYTVKLKGSEIENMLAYSVSKFYRNVNGKKSSLLKYNNQDNKLSENCKNLESVGGLRYNVHINKTKDNGKLEIIGLSNGRSFEPDKEYTVAVGEEFVMNTNLALSLGAKLKTVEIQKRVSAVSEKDMAELIVDYIKENKNVELKPMNNWKLLPVAWVNDIKKDEIERLNLRNSPGTEILSEEK